MRYLSRGPRKGPRPDGTHGDVRPPSGASCGLWLQPTLGRLTLPLRPAGHVFSSSGRSCLVLRSVLPSLALGLAPCVLRPVLHLASRVLLPVLPSLVSCARSCPSSVATAPLASCPPYLPLDAALLQRLTTRLASRRHPKITLQRRR